MDVLQFPLEGTPERADDTFYNDQAMSPRVYVGEGELTKRVNGLKVT
jgi:hypothetical protein